MTEESPGRDFDRHFAPSGSIAFPCSVCVCTVCVQTSEAEPFQQGEGRERWCQGLDSLWAELVICAPERCEPGPRAPREANKLQRSSVVRFVCRGMSTDSASAPSSPKPLSSAGGVSPCESRGCGQTPVSAAAVKVLVHVRSLEEERVCDCCDGLELWVDLWGLWGLLDLLHGLWGLLHEAPPLEHGLYLADVSLDLCLGNRDCVDGPL